MEQLGRYRLESKLAQGGMAEVFLARQQNPGGAERVCVVKRMLAHLTEDVTFIEMFLDEARVVARLAHPGIAQVYDFGHESDSYFLALEYVAGANLKAVLDQRLEARKPVPLPVAGRLISLVAQALDYAHHATDEKGAPLDVVHRDVSPHNVMVGLNGEVKLIDFGIAKAKSDSHRTVAGTLKGKYAYMSPEQLRQQRVDQRTDIYALGLVLYELITGRAAVPPNENLNALMMAAAQRRYAPLDQYRPETPKRLRQILDKALALDPNDRFSRGNELSDQLEEWIQSLGVRVTAKDVALLVDPKLVSTDPMAQAAVAPARTPTPRDAFADDEQPPTVIGVDGSEARTQHEMQLPRGLRETIASRGRVEASRTPQALAAAADPSQDPTPIVGTPAVARRGVGSPTDVSLIPTEPEKQAPDIAAAMARPARKSASAPKLDEVKKQSSQRLEEVKKQSSQKLEEVRKQSSPGLDEVTSPSVPKPAPITTPPADGGRVPLDLGTVPPTLETETMPPMTQVMAPPAARAAAASPGRRWPLVLLMVVMLPIGAVSAGIVFLPKDSPLRAKLLQVVGPLLQKVHR